MVTRCHSRSGQSPARLGLLVACTLAISSGCSSTGVGNPGPIASLSLAIVADDDEGSPGEQTEPALARGSLSQAVLVIGSVSTVPCDPEAASTVHEGPFVVDLLSGSTEPEVPAFELPEGGICGLDAPLAPARDSAELGGRSFYFRGVRADGLEFIVFADLRVNLHVRVDADAAFGVDESSRGVVWAMRPRRWTREAELSTAQPLGWGNGRRSIVIDANRHPLLLAAIAARLGSQSGVFADPNRNGSIDASERAQGEVGSVSSEVEE
jgi:hypothetical protein